MITAERLEPIDKDTLLQASRRLDWRFLLPDPHLKRVAYVGPQQSSLLQSLALFSESLVVVHEARGDRGTTERYSLVVVGEPSHRVLKQAAELVEPGGFLYLEAHGLFWPARWWRAAIRQLSTLRLHSPAGCTMAVKNLGFGEVQVHWHWPSCESGTRIIPLANVQALLYALGLNGEGKMANLKTGLIRWLWQVGLLAQLAPCFSIVAQQGAE